MVISWNFPIKNAGLMTIKNDKCGGFNGDLHGDIL
jgi:hypothetical protein